MREGNVFSLSTPVGGGVPRPGPAGAGGYPRQVQPGGYPCEGVPHLRYPPHRTWLGGYPTLGTNPTPVRPGWGGGTPLQETDGVLDMAWSVCLLHSRRRTFLLGNCVWSFKLKQALPPAACSQYITYVSHQQKHRQIVWDNCKLLLLHLPWFYQTAPPGPLIPLGLTLYHKDPVWGVPHLKAAYARLVEPGSLLT